MIVIIILIITILWFSALSSFFVRCNWAGPRSRKSSGAFGDFQTTSDNPGIFRQWWLVAVIIKKNNWNVIRVIMIFSSFRISIGKSGQLWTQQFWTLEFFTSNRLWLTPKHLPWLSSFWNYFFSQQALTGLHHHNDRSLFSDQGSFDPPKQTFQLFLLLCLGNNFIFYPDFVLIVLTGVYILRII